ncbi:MAG: hypothetical protein OJF50_006362, partial [Nitrospira sp.]|nr:hypothetical protein [Nitrospira sp.]
QTAFPAANYDQISCGAPAPCTPSSDASPAVPSAASATVGSIGFTASAVASIDNDPTIDGWSVNDIKGGLTQALPDDVVS